MISTGLSASDRKALATLLKTSHGIYSRVRLMDLNHGYIEDISDMLMSGQVNYDNTADVDRTLDVDLLDPKHALHLDSNSPAEGAIYLDRMLQVHYVVISADLKTEFSIPVFTGPIAGLERSGDIISVTCVGKEIFGLGTAWTPKTFAKKMNRVKSIRYILTEMMGESSKYLDFADSKSTLPNKVAIGMDAQPWKVAKQIANGLGFQLFYDGRGVCRLRKVSRLAIAKIEDGPSGNLLTDVEAGYDTDSIVNAVKVLGFKPKGKRQITAQVIVPKADAFSPSRLGRTGGPRYIPAIIEDDSIKTQKEAVRRAKELLARGREENITQSMDVLPIPYLELLDRVRVESEAYSATMAVSSMGLPLIPGAMTLGYNKNLSPRVKALRK